MKKGIVWIIVAMSCLSIFSTLFAQDSGILSAITLDRLGLLYTPGTGARPLAMGGAFTAVSDDAFALIYNPAGLAQIRREELSLGFHHLRNENSSRYTISTTENSYNSTTFGHLSFVYPFPTYRGALVLGFGIFKVGSSDIELIRNGFISDINATVQNQHIQSGNLYQYRIGVGVDISPNVSLGAGLAIWDESIDFVDLIHYEDPGSLVVWRDDVSLDVDGLSLGFGLLFRINSFLKAGLMVTSPTWLSLSGDGVTDYYGSYKNGGEEWITDPDYGVIDEDYTLPMKFRAGVAFVFPVVTVSSDISYCDYTQTKRFGKSLLDEFSVSGKHALEDVLSYNVGFEVNPESIPMRLRGGYAYTPLALTTTDEITIIEEDYPTSFIDDIGIVKQRQTFSLGIGTLVDRSLAVDATVTYTSYEYETTDSAEKRNTLGVIISTAYRF